MKAVAPRIERLYESEVERWRTAWERFFKEFWRPLSTDEIQAFEDYAGLTLEEQAALASIIEAWNEEAGTLPDDGAAWNTFFDEFDEAVPSDYKNRINLSLWPDCVPVSPPDVPEMWQIARREIGEGEDERLAAGIVLFMLAMGRAARIYSREAR